MRHQLTVFHISEVDRVVHIAQTPFISHKTRQMIYDGIWAGSRVRLTRRHIGREVVRKRVECKYALGFLKDMNRHANSMFRASQMHTREKEIEDTEKAAYLAE